MDFAELCEQEDFVAKYREVLEKLERESVDQFADWLIIGLSHGAELAQIARSKVVQLPLRKDDERDADLMFRATMSAIQSGEKDTLVRLLDKGVGVNQRHGMMMSPLMWAAKYKQTEIVRTMIEHGADVELVSFSGTVLHQAAWSNTADIVRLVCSVCQPKLLNARDKDDRTALHAAALQSSVEAMEALLVAGAEIEAQDRNGSTPLLVACRQQSAAVVSCLVRRGANLLAKDRAGMGARELVRNPAIARLLGLSP